MSAGIFTTVNLTDDLAAKSYAGTLTRLMPNGNAPLFILTSMLGTETAVQIEHGFFTKTMLFPQLTLSAAGQLIGDVVFTVLSTANIVPGMIFRVQSTGENVIINTVLSATQVSVVRAVGSTAAAAIAASVNLYQVGNAFEEGSIRPNSVIINPVRITNLTQIFRNTWAVTGSVRATQMIAGESNVAESRQDCAKFHAADIEKSLLFGQKSQGVRNGMPFRTMDGFVSIVSNAAYYPPLYAGVPNVSNAGATTNFTQLEGFLDPCFNQTTDPSVANERTMFVGGIARRVINQIGRLSGQYNMVRKETGFGMQFSEFTTSRGMFRMIEHPLLNTNADWQRLAFVVDLSSFRVAYLGDRKTQSEDFNEGDADNGVDAEGGTLTTEMTTVMKNPPANAYITNLTQGAAG